MSGRPRLGCLGAAAWPGSLWCHLRCGVTAAVLSWPLVLGAEYGWLWFGGGWSPQVMPAVLTVAFAAWGVFSALVRHREELERSAGSLRQMWPWLTPVATAALWAVPMAVMSRWFVSTYSDEYLRDTDAGFIAVPWVLASVPVLIFTLWLRAGWRTAQREHAEAEAKAAAPQSRVAAGPAPGEVWFAIPPLEGGGAAAMKERPCVVLEPPAGAGVLCVSCTSQVETAQRRGYPRLDTSGWSTAKDETFVRVDMVAVVPLPTFRKRVAVLDSATFAEVTAAVRARRTRRS